jgi:hypothetical protein
MKYSLWRGTKLKNRKLKISVLLIATLIATVGIYSIWANVGPKSTGLAGDNSEFSLVRPAFAQSMAAATTFLDQEAGISIYLNTGSSISINAVAPILRNIENQTSDWVIGSVPLPSPFIPSDWPHCFVHKSGWIVVYYLRPTSQNTAYISKMIDWKPSVPAVNSPLDDDKLKKGLNVVCTPLGIPTTNAQYYHFQYPNATNLLMVVKTTINTVSSARTYCNIEIPANVTVYEQSWSHQNYVYSYYSHFLIDGTMIDAVHSTQVTYGILPLDASNPLTEGSFHQIQVEGDNNYCAVCLCILYS